LTLLVAQVGNTPGKEARGVPRTRRCLLVGYNLAADAQEGGRGAVVGPASKMGETIAHAARVCLSHRLGPARF